MCIRISWDNGETVGKLDDTPTARKLFATLAYAATANTWGDEVYFSVPVRSDLERDAEQVVATGTICFWVKGQSLAIPFGPTPASRSGKCRLVTRVNVVGKLEGDARVLEPVCAGDAI